MNGKLRKLVQTNMVLYILLLLVFAGLTARLSPPVRWRRPCWCGM